MSLTQEIVDQQSTSKQCLQGLRRASAGLTASATKCNTATWTMSMKSRRLQESPCTHLAAEEFYPAGNLKEMEDCKVRLILISYVTCNGSNYCVLYCRVVWKPLYRYSTGYPLGPLSVTLSEWATVGTMFYTSVGHTVGEWCWPHCGTISWPISCRLHM